MRPTPRALLAIAVAIATFLATGQSPATAHRLSSPHAAASRHHRTHTKGHRHRGRHRGNRRHKHPGRAARASRDFSRAGHAGEARRGATRASLLCAGADLIPDGEDLAQVRSATICLVNRERVLHGERPLTVNGKLDRAAQGHSEDMVAQDYFSHYGPAGDTPGSRMRAAGYIYSSNVGYEVGENIAWGTLDLATPRSIVEAWMHSPGHRENILDAHYRETGMGVVAAVPRSDSAGQPGAIYTQDFGVLIAG